MATLRCLMTLSFIMMLTIAAQPVSAHWYRHAHPTHWANVPHGAEHKHYNHRERYNIRDHHKRRLSAHQFKKDHKHFWRKMKNYRFPKVGHQRLDYCFKKNRFCGRVAANEFCKLNGFSYASQFKVDRHAYLTRNLGDRNMNHYHKDHGNGFTYIRCRKH